MFICVAIVPPGEQLREHRLELIRQGADILDIGGESTRPGAEPVSLVEELHRVVPVVQALAGKATVPISVDTSKAEVARVCHTYKRGGVVDLRFFLVADFAGQVENRIFRDVRWVQRAELLDYDFLDADRSAAHRINNGYRGRCCSHCHS